MKKKFFFLILILLFGSFLRLYNFNNTLNLDTDQAAAFILADRIINDNHVLLVGPYTTIWEVNILAPTYYYLITMLFFLLGNEISVAYVFAILGIFSIYLIYLLGKTIGNVKTGLISALFYAVSYVLINYARNIWEPHLVPLFVIITYYLLFQSRQNKSLALYLLALISFVISLMYISSFLLLPILFIHSTAILKSIRPGIKMAYFKNALLCLIILLFFYLPVIVFEVTQGYPSISFIVELVKGNTTYLSLDFQSFISSLSSHLNIFATSVFQNSKYNILLYIIILLTIFILLSTKKKSLFPPKIMFFSFIFSFILTGFYSEKPEVYRLAALYPLFYFIMAFILTVLFKRYRNKNIFLKSVTLIYFVVIMIFIINNLTSYRSVLSANEKSSYGKPFAIAETILKDAAGENFQLYTVVPSDKYNHHVTPYYWALEKITGRRFVSLNKNGNWVNQEINNDTRMVYLICRNISILYLAKKNCIDFFMAENNFLKIEKTINMNNVTIAKVTR